MRLSHMRPLSRHDRLLERRRDVVNVVADQAIVATDEAHGRPRVGGAKFVAPDDQVVALEDDHVS